MSRNPLAWRLGAWALAVLWIALPLVNAHGVLWQATTVPKAAVLRVVVAVVLAGAAAVLLRAKVSVRVAPVVWFAIALIAWAAVTTAASSARHISFFGSVHRYEGWVGFAGYLALFVIAHILGRGRRERPALVAWATGLLCGVVGLLAAAQYSVAPSWGPAFLSVVPLERSSAAFGNPLFLGLFAALAVPPALAAAIGSTISSGQSAVPGEKRPMRRAALIVSIVGASLVLAAAYFTHSRGAWLGLATGCGILVLLLRGEGRRLMGLSLVVLVLAAGVVIGGTALHERRGLRSEDLSVSSRVGEVLTGGGSVGTRFELYRGGLQLWSERPITGWGLETYASQGSRVRTLRLAQLEAPSAAPDRPHNPQIYMAYALGTPGLILYAGLLVSAFLAAVGRFRRSSGVERALVAGLLSGCLGYLAAESTSFSTVEVTPLFWVALGWISAGDTRSESGPAVPPALLRAVGAALAVGVLAWAGFVGAHTYAITRADALHLALVDEPRDPAGLRDLERREAEATALDPYTPYYWNARGLLLARDAEISGRHEVFTEARAVFTEGLSHTPGDPTLVVSLSDVELRAGRPADAARMLEAHLVRDPYLADARFNLGVAYLALDRPAEAAEELEKAVEIVPSDAEAFWLLGTAYDLLGAAPAAEAARARALELDPGVANPG